jgi:predicted RNase H-like HicB family nuclease
LKYRKLVSEGKTLQELKENIIGSLKLILEVKLKLKKPKKIRSTTLIKKKTPSNIYELSV